MKTQYQYFQFIKIAQKPKTSVWSCRNVRDEYSGYVEWYGPWRQYCYFADPGGIYNKGCLVDIGSFLAELAEEREQQRAMDRLEG